MYSPPPHKLALRTSLIVPIIIYLRLKKRAMKTSTIFSLTLVKLLYLVFKNRNWIVYKFLILKDSNAFFEVFINVCNEYDIYFVYGN